MKLTWSFLENMWELGADKQAKGVRDYHFKMLDKAHKKKEEGEEPTTSGFTVLVLYWVCLHTKLVEIIERQKNMIPAITR
ncbi:hypothetical protein DVH24_025926 [Malus domestica]|uniref:Uncharacterized protein n=1 Tax=Malus domestica TaxID=3750 RepID=A0A498KEK8_MALDO|nr:hypothetical protein DVH24_025926 [Malus domestica]